MEVQRMTQNSVCWGMNTRQGQTYKPHKTPTPWAFRKATCHDTNQPTPLGGDRLPIPTQTRPLHTSPHKTRGALEPALGLYQHRMWLWDPPSPYLARGPGKACSSSCSFVP